MNIAKKTVTLVHKTCLAGFGAFDSGREIAVNKFDQLFVDSSAFVNDLLEKGESLETQLQAKIEASKMLKEKISALRAKLGFGSESRDQQVDVLAQRVDNLIAVVAKLAQQKAVEKKVTSTASAKKVPAVSPVKPVAKTSAKKAPSKPAAKTLTAKPATTKTSPAKSAAVKATPAVPAAVKTETAKPSVAKPTAAKLEADDKD